MDLLYLQSQAIYLDGVNGSDENDGLSVSTAVKTFEKAKALAEGYETTNIYVIGTITISSGNETWDGTVEDGTLRLIRYKELTDAALVELDGGSLTLSNITIDGNLVSSTAALIRVYDSESTLTISDGTVITKNVNTSSDLSNSPNNAAVCVVSGSLVMTGGEVTGNTGSSWGGGIAITPLPDTSASMEITGGTVSGNEAGNGGGIYMRGNVTFTMNGGTITNNTATSYGGGLYVGAGAIATIYAGYITDNVCKGTAWGGGGIYVNNAQADYSAGKLYLYNAEIAYNQNTSGATASYGYDSAISSCETGVLEVNITDGAVIHDNYTEHAIQVRQYDTSSTFILSPVMLGGYPYNWTDGNGNPISLTDTVYSQVGWLTFDTDVSTENGTVSGLNRIKTYITGNSSVYLGAAIGTNGEVYIGKSDGDATLNIEKAWYTDEENSETPESVTINVYAADGEGTKTYIGSVVLSESNEWKTTITNLPKYDSDGNLYTYSIEEEAVDGWYTTIEEETNTSGTTYDEDEDKTATYSYTVTNVPTIDINGTKSWDDNDNQDGIRPESITIKLLANWEVIDSVDVTEAEDGTWTYTFTGLPKYSSGKEVIYSITEDVVTDYTTTYDDYDITNSYTPGKVRVTVTKAWDDKNDKDGIRPESVTVILVKNGEATDQTLTLSTENNWTDSFTDLDEYTDGELNVYTVQEVETDGYTAVITGDASTGFIITNTHTVTTTETEYPSDTTDETTTGTSTNTTDNTSSGSTSSTSSGSSAKTGDNTPIALYLVIMLLGIACLCGGVIYKRSRRKTK